MTTPNARILEILADGVIALDKAGSLSEQEALDAEDYLQHLEANIDDMRPEGNPDDSEAWMGMG